MDLYSSRVWLPVQLLLHAGEKAELSEDLLSAISEVCPEWNVRCQMVNLVKER